MISWYFFSILVALSPLISTTSGAPMFENSVLGRREYQMEYARYGNLWNFYVYSDGYDGTVKEKPIDEKLPVDHVQVNTATKTLIVLEARNANDKTRNRLRMRQILKECWTKTGLKPLELNYVQGKSIQNFNMESATASCRKSMGFGARGDFKVSPTGTAKGSKECWEELEKTVFSHAINAAIRDFGLSKKLVEIEVTYGWMGDNVLYTFH